MRLINKKWGFQNKEFEIPLEEGEGTIKEKSSSQVYGLGQKKDCSYGKKVKLQSRGKKRNGCETASDSQQWIRSKSDVKGQFTLKNKVTGLLLTAENQKTFIVTGI